MTDSISTEETVKMNGTVTVTVLDVGKADSILIQTQTHNILIDCATKKEGTTVGDYLTSQGITTIDCIISTHYDQDHIGGTPYILDHFDVKAVYGPGYEKSGEVYQAYLDALSENNLTEISLHEDISFAYDEAKFIIDVPKQDDYGQEPDNNYSLVTELFFGNRSFLFTGDAMEQRLQELMNVGHFDVLKMPYHGRAIANMIAFLDEVQPSYAIISSTKKETAKTTKTILDERNVTRFATYKYGNISVTTDGNTLTFHVDKNTSDDNANAEPIDPKETAPTTTPPPKPDGDKHHEETITDTD